MDRNGFVAVFLFLLIVVDVSDASLMWKLRGLVGMNPNDESMPTQLSPSPSPVPGHKNLDPNLKDVDKSKDPEVSNNSSKADPKGSNDTVPVSPPPNTSKPQKDKSDHEHEKKNDNKTDTRLVIGENCDGVPNNCSLLDSLITCFRTSKDGGREIVVLVQNEGNSTQKVHLSVPNSVKSSKQLEIPQHQTERINISLSKTSTTVILNAGKGDCRFPLGPMLPEGNSFLHLPSYDKLVTPINGAYLLIFTVIILGGSWACCKFSKKRWQGGVPYQELEMAVPETGSANIVESAEGWDQDWGDDWDEEKAVKSPVSRHVPNISANGLTARSANKEGWENDWDD